MRLKGSTVVVIGALMALALVYATDQIVPATSAHEAGLRIWLAARASGIVAFVLLTIQVALGLVLSHPTNQAQWRLSKRLFPWHENLSVFLAVFLAAHILSLVLDPYAGVGLGGALVPGLSGYRSAPVAVGVMALYGLIAVALTARYPRRLPAGAWLSIHRVSLLVFVLAWIHGVVAGSDAQALEPLYLGAGLLVLLCAAYRYWVPPRVVARAAAAVRGGLK